MDAVQEYENTQSIIVLDKLIDFLNQDNTSVNLMNTTMIGRKYVAVNGSEKKEIDVTSGNTMIVSFYGDEFQDRFVVYHEEEAVKSKLKVINSLLIRQSEKAKLITNLNNVIDFLNCKETVVDLPENIYIGKKYTAVNGNKKKEIYITNRDVSIVSFNDNTLEKRDIINVADKDIKSKINTMTAVLERDASNKNIKTKIQYYWKRFKELQYQK